jgi:hypothetical protein
MLVQVWLVTPLRAENKKTKAGLSNWIIRVFDRFIIG